MNDDEAYDAWLANLKEAARYLLAAGKTREGLAVQACVTMLEDDSEDEPQEADRG